uniref:Threonine dehydratase regulatory domain protein n=1 Tax=Myoviridae sp. ctwSu1 TaxID=2825207 RepID=A0A8S5U187_9CAUD|nr:MAG TPA: threonine dehydratase regulatory domain protein [Myoviridae sp. ctwSu1]
MATQKPTLNPKAPAKNGFNYKPKFGLIIQCDDEDHQQTIFEQLKQLGYKAKVVVV